MPSKKEIQAAIMESELRTQRGRVEGSVAAWIADGLMIEEQKYVPKSFNWKKILRASIVFCSGLQWPIRSVAWEPTVPRVDLPLHSSDTSWLLLSQLSTMRGRRHKPEPRTEPEPEHTLGLGFGLGLGLGPSLGFDLCVRKKPSDLHGL